MMYFLVHIFNNKNGVKKVHFTHINLYKSGNIGSGKGRGEKVGAQRSRTLYTITENNDNKCLIYFHSIY